MTLAKDVPPAGMLIELTLNETSFVDVTPVEVKELEAPRSTTSGTGSVFVTETVALTVCPDVTVPVATFNETFVRTGEDALAGISLIVSAP